MTIFVATSKRFYPEAQSLCQRIEGRGYRTFHPFFERDQAAIEADPSVKIAVTNEHFPEIAASEMLYALTPNGYVGASVLIEMTYAFALGKSVVTSEPVSEYAARALVSNVAAPDAFLASLVGDKTRIN
jgi:hypothetical protein